MALRRKHVLCILAAMVVFSGECSAKTWEEAFRTKFEIPQPEYQVHYLEHLRSTFDPQRRSFLDAVFNGNNEIGIVVNPRMTTNDIVVMLRTFLTDMSMRFPGQDLAVTALTSENPPREIGTSYYFSSSHEVFFQPMP